MLGMLPQRTVLVIDESAEFRAVVREALEIEGYTVLEASDGREGMRIFRQAGPSLVLLDMVMPEKDGIETLREIFSIDPRAQVLTFSGRNGADEHNETALLLGAKRAFRKPFLIEDLLEAIRTALSGRPPGSA